MNDDGTGHARSYSESVDSLWDFLIYNHTTNCSVEACATLGNSVNHPLTMLVSSSCIRLHSDGLSTNESNNFFSQICELKLQVISEAASASSTTPGWEPDDLCDGDLIGRSTDFPADLYATLSRSEWSALNPDENTQVTATLLSPRPGGPAFPVGFALQTSTTGTTRPTVSSQSYSGHMKSGNLLQAQRTQIFAASDASTTPGLPASNLVGGHPDPLYSSVGHTSASASKSLIVDLEGAVAVEGERSADHPPPVLCVSLDPAKAWLTDSVATDPLFDPWHVVAAVYFRITATMLRQDNLTT